MLLEADDETFAHLISGAAMAGLPVAEGGLESAEVLSMLRVLAEGVRQRFSPAAWLVVEGGEVVGLCSLLQAPDAAGVVNIGYGVAKSRRGRGIARRAVADLIAWANDVSAITAIGAETSVENVASQRVLEQNGAVRLGLRSDPEDGELVCWTICLQPKPSPPPSGS